MPPPSSMLNPNHIKQSRQRIPCHCSVNLLNGCRRIRNVITLTCCLTLLGNPSTPSTLAQQYQATSAAAAAAAPGRTCLCHDMNAESCTPLADDVLFRCYFQTEELDSPPNGPARMVYCSMDGYQNKKNTLCNIPIRLKIASAAASVQMSRLRTADIGDIYKYTAILRGILDAFN